MIPSFLLGILTWSLFEYLLHRYIGHSKKVINGFSQEHRSHHVDGNYFMRLPKKVRVSLQVIVPLTLISIYCFQILGLCFALGFTTFFIAYEILHKRCHTHPPKTAYGHWMRKHHFFHHFGAPKKNFGVTSPLWDLIFRSYTPVSLIRLPRKKAMTWLLDPQTQEILPQFSDDYKLRTPHRKSS